jgi:asparaginyl-tRNA synthetase
LFSIDDRFIVDMRSVKVLLTIIIGSMKKINHIRDGDLIARLFPMLIMSFSAATRVYELVSLVGRRCFVRPVQTLTRHPRPLLGSIHTINHTWRHTFVTQTNKPLRSLTIRQILEQSQVGTSVCVQGWIRSVRTQKQVTFVDINDGSCTSGIQAVIETPVSGLATGCAVQLQGLLVPSPGRGQTLELQTQQVHIIGTCDAASYPLQKKRHTFEFLREWIHLRSRTRTLGAVVRTRNQVLQACHQFFQANDFVQVNTPILTSHDCEGGGEVFSVATTPGDRTTPDVSSFFGRPVYLTVSGQLQLEAMASAISRVYTLGPTFRAEPSQTSRHLAEFWMLEAEVAFLTELDELLDLCEACVQHLTQHIREHCADELDLFARWIDPKLPERLTALAGDKQSYARMTYTEAIKVLEQAPVTFTYTPTWGAALQSEHERYLAERYCQRPVFITDYPAAIKAFYMLPNPTSYTVACTDLLVPGVGELIGGSLRESDETRLRARMRAMGMHEEALNWYIDLRRFGGTPHGGFGLGIEPRYTGHCPF